MDEVEILKKFLNNEKFLTKFPMINRVFVNNYDKDSIDIVISVKENMMRDYIKSSTDVRNYIYNMQKIVGIRKYLTIFP
jgi:hypothetical protein